jgi:hypothetical protein
MTAVTQLSARERVDYYRNLQRAAQAQLRRIGVERDKLWAEHESAAEGDLAQWISKVARLNGEIEVAGDLYRTFTAKIDQATEYAQQAAVDQPVTESERRIRELQQQRYNLAGRQPGDWLAVQQKKRDLAKIDAELRELQEQFFLNIAGKDVRR